MLTPVPSTGTEQAGLPSTDCQQITHSFDSAEEYRASSVWSSDQTDSGQEAVMQEAVGHEGGVVVVHGADAVRRWGPCGGGRGGMSGPCGVSSVWGCQGGGDTAVAVRKVTSRRGEPGPSFGPGPRLPARCWQGRCACPVSLAGLETGSGPRAPVAAGVPRPPGRARARASSGR